MADGADFKQTHSLAYSELKYPKVDYDAQMTAFLSF